MPDEKRIERENDERYEPGWREGIWIEREHGLESSRCHQCGHEAPAVAGVHWSQRDCPKCGYRGSMVTIPEGRLPVCRWYTCTNRVERPDDEWCRECFARKLSDAEANPCTAPDCCGPEDGLPPTQRRMFSIRTLEAYPARNLAEWYYDASTERDELRKALRHIANGQSDPATYAKAVLGDAP